MNSIFIKSTTNEVEQPTSFYNRKKVEGDGSVTTLPSLSTIKSPKKTAIPATIQTTPPNTHSSNIQDRRTGRQTDQQANKHPRRQTRKKSESSEATPTQAVRIGGHLTGSSRRSVAYQEALKTRPKYTQHARVGSEEFREEAKKNVLNQENRGVCSKENCRAFRGSTKIDFDDSTDCKNSPHFFDSHFVGKYYPDNTDITLIATATYAHFDSYSNFQKKSISIHRVYCRSLGRVLYFTFTLLIQTYYS